MAAGLSRGLQTAPVVCLGARQLGQLARAADLSRRGRGLLAIGKPPQKKAGPGKGNRTKGPRPKALTNGARKTFNAIESARKLVGDEHPIVLEATSTLLGVMRGDIGYRGRYVGERLRAATQLLDRVRGKALDARRNLGHIDSGDDADPTQINIEITPVDPVPLEIDEPDTPAGE